MAQERQPRCRGKQAKDHSQPSSNGPRLDASPSLGAPPTVPSAANRQAGRSCAGICPYNLQAPWGLARCCPRQGWAWKSPSVNICQMLNTVAPFFNLL